jgi:hypothetical protein
MTKPYTLRSSQMRVELYACGFWFTKQNFIQENGEDARISRQCGDEMQFVLKTLKYAGMKDVN